MPKRTHEHKKHHKEESSQAGFITDEHRTTMNKNEKIIMGVLVVGIIAFLVLSIMVLFGRQNKNETNTGAPTGGTTKVNLTPYPTIPPIKDMTVMINSRRFNPSSVTIPRGGYVDFLNVDSGSIAIEGNDENSSILDIGVIESSEDKLVTFSTPGTYTYRNKNKPTMTGIIIVK